MSHNLTSNKITCISCGTRFIRASLYHGNYCSDCRVDIELSADTETATETETQESE